MFDTPRFLSENFGTPDSTVALLQTQVGYTPNREAVRKWFSRGAVPSDWFPVLIIALERYAGAPVPLINYLHGGQFDVFA